MRYTEPKIAKAKKGWYVWFKLDGKIIKNKLGEFGFNRIADLTVREREFEAARKEISNALRLKYPDNLPAYHIDETVADGLTFIKAIDMALELKRGRVSKEWHQDLSRFAASIKKAVNRLQYQKLPIKETKRIHIKIIIDEIKNGGDFSTDGAYNTGIAKMQSLLSALVRKFIIEVNPASKQEKNKITRELRKTANEKEEKVISSYLLENDRNFYQYVKTIRATGIRPMELLSIKVHMIDMLNREIHLPKTITKNKKPRTVGMSMFVFEYFLSIDLSRRDPNDYIFGTTKPKGKHGYDKAEMFIVAPHPILRRKATSIWEQYVKTDLRIDVDMYAEKHSGANDLQKAGVDIKTIQNQFGHYQSRQTEVYTTKNLHLDVIKKVDIRYDGLNT